MLDDVLSKCELRWFWVGIVSMVEAPVTVESWFMSIYQYLYGPYQIPFKSNLCKATEHVVLAGGGGRGRVGLY